MESVRPSGDGAHLTVGAFRARVRQPCCNVGNDAVEMLGNRSSHLGEGLEARVRGPRYLLLELHQHDIRLTAIENGSERFLEQVGVVEPFVRLRQLGQLCLLDCGEVPGVLLQRKPSVLQRASILGSSSVRKGEEE